MRQGKVLACNVGLKIKCLQFRSTAPKHDILQYRQNGGVRHEELEYRDGHEDQGEDARAPAVCGDQAFPIRKHAGWISFSCPLQDAHTTSKQVHCVPHCFVT